MQGGHFAVPEGDFPRIRAGASLKPGFVVVHVVVDRGFPPHSCGGLIEAFLIVFGSVLARLISPAFVRGPH